VTVFDSNGISKVFEESDKLFQLAGLRIGIATFGVAGLEGRTIGSFIREFERQAQVGGGRLSELSLRELAEELRKFFLGVYIRYAENLFAQPFAAIPPEKKGALGLIVGGFSPGAFLSEVWQILIPWHDQPNSGTQVYGQGQFGSAWFATSEPIQRYIKGIDPGLTNEILNFIKQTLGRDLTAAESDDFAKLLKNYECATKIDGMPIKAGVDYVRFLVNLVINHYRFAATHPIVGGKAKLGVVTYRQDSFRFLG
jgi:hypothetical protein